MSGPRVKIDTLNLYHLKLSFGVSPENNEWKMNLASLSSGLAIACTFLLTSRWWLEFVVSDFRRARAVVVESMMFNSFCPESRLILTAVWMFGDNWFVWLWESHLSLCSCFHLCPRWWGNYAWSVEKGEKKDSSGASKWWNSIQFHQWTLHPVLGRCLLYYLSTLYQAVHFFHHEDVWFL